MERGECAGRLQAEDGAAAGWLAQWIGRSTRRSGSIEVAVVSQDQATRTTAVGAVRRGAEGVHNLEPRACLADAEQHAAIFGATHEGHTIEESIVGLHQGGCGLIAIKVLAAAVRSKSEEQRELAGGRDFE